MKDAVLTAKVTLTPYDVAKIFCEMNSEEQSAFFLHVGGIVDSWENAPCMQWGMVSDQMRKSNGSARWRAAEMLKSIGDEVS